MLFPCVAKQCQLRNVELALRHLTKPFDAALIADGHREQTLGALWQLFVDYQLDALINAKYLFDDVQTILNGSLIAPITSTVSIPNNTIDALKKWASAIFAKTDVACPNFAGAFSDGHLFCQLVHFYASDLLSRETLATGMSKEEIKERRRYFFDQLQIVAMQMTPPMPLLSITSFLSIRASLARGS